MCGISKATYYNHQHPDDRFKEKYRHLKKFVEKIIKNNSAYGVKRIKAALWQECHIFIGRDALSRLLRLWKLNIHRKVKRPKPSIIKKILIRLAGRANLFIRTKITRPLQAITSDITELNYNYGKSIAYLCLHKDSFGQMVYGYTLDQTKQNSLTLNSLANAVKNIKRRFGHLSKDILFHQDQGSQYTSYQYVDAVLKLGRISFSQVGTPTENPGQESFFGRFKQEWADEIYEIQDFKELKKFIKKKIHYYNYQRIHTSTGLTTPYQFTITYSS